MLAFQDTPHYTSDVCVSQKLCLQAVASAMALGYVSATSSCNNVCHSDVSALTEAVGSVLATAASDSLKEQCVGTSPFKFACQPVWR